MIRVIFNQKGGVGKSTISCNLAAVAASRGKKVLLIDLDSQCNASQYLLGRDKLPEEGIADFFKDHLYLSFFQSRSLSSVISPTPFEGLFLISASPELEDMGAKLESRYKMFKLKEGLEKLEDFDEVYIDTPPALNFFSRSALIASDFCLVPFDCDAFSRNALHTLVKSVEEISHDHNPALSIEGVIINHYQARASMPEKMVDMVKEEGFKVIPAYLSSSVKIRESHFAARPMIFFDPKHKLSREFEALYSYISEEK